MLFVAESGKGGVYVLTRTLCICFLGALFCMGTAASSLSVVGSGGSWQPLALDMLNEDRSPFFDNPTYDIGYKSIGFCLLTTICGLPIEPGPVEFWGIGEAVDSNVYFSATGPIMATMMLEISAYSSWNRLGWYDAANPTVLHEIFAGADSPGKQVVFTPSANFGLYIQSPEGVFLSQSDYNAQVAAYGKQHLGIFQSQRGIIVSAEDLLDPKLEGLMDQDLAALLQPVPEPSTIALIALGLAGVFIRRLSRKAS